MLLVDGYVVVLAAVGVLAAVVGAVLVVMVRRANRRLLEVTEQLQSLKRQSKGLSQAVSSSKCVADGIIQRQHQRLLEHLLAGSASEFQKESGSAAEAIQEGAGGSNGLEQVAQVVARKIIEELNKKW